VNSPLVRLDGGVQGQQVGLVGDVVDDGDLVGDLLHGHHGLAHGLATGQRFIGGEGIIVSDCRPLPESASGFLAERFRTE
jgi:hypothetical protein